MKTKKLYNKECIKECNKRSDNKRSDNKRSDNKQSNIVYHTFEDKIEKAFKDKGLDFPSLNNALEKQMLHQFKEAVNVNKIRPENDFYSFINERWMKDFKVEENQKYIVQVDDFRLVQDKVYKELLQAVEKQIHVSPSTTFSQNMKHFYDSTDKYNFKKTKMLEHVNNYVSYLKNNNSLWNLLGYINQNEIISFGCPLLWTLNPDDKEPDIYRCHLSGPTLSLIDINVYFEDGTNLEYKKKYKNNFFQYLNSLFEFVFGKDHGHHIKDIFDIEVKIINTFICSTPSTSKDHDSSENYYKVSKNEAHEKYGIDWTAFSKAIGFEKTPDFFIVSDTSYLKCITTLLNKEWNTSSWNTYWIYIYIRQIVRFIHDGRKIYYNFNGRFVRGMEDMVDNHLFRIFPIAFAYNNFLTKKYIEENDKQREISYIKALAEDLLTVFKRIITRNTWMQDQTKQKALIKLNKIKLEVGQPDNLREDPNVTYSSDDIWDNLTKIAKWRVNKAVHLEGKRPIEIAVIDWSKIPPKFVSKQAYVVNAFYTPIENSIYIPLGYIQKPFIDLEERGKEYNLAQIGYTLSHEMSHSLDDRGSKYDENGKLYNWWTPKDAKKFKEIQKEVIKQYEAFALRDGIHFDATLSIGEDMADISGLNICTEYLRDFQLLNKDTLPIQKISFNMFFIYFAIQYREKLSKKAINAQLKTNPHPLDKYRCNVPLSRMPIFRILYNVAKKDKMWWHSTNRIWEN